MTLRTLVLRSLRFHWRSHLGVLLGAAVGSAALIGALLVGDSVRETLRHLALQGLGRVQSALDTGDRFFRTALAEEIAASLDPFQSGTALRAAGPSTVRAAHAFTAVLQLRAAASTVNDGARANQVRLFGVATNFARVAGGGGAFATLDREGVLLNRSLAGQLRSQVGDTVVLRARKPDALGADSPLAPTEGTELVLRLQVRGILEGEELGNLSLAPGQGPPLNAFVQLELLQARTDLAGRANLLLSSLEPDPTHPGELGQALRRHLQLADWQLQFRPVTNRSEIELRTPRIFLDSPQVDLLFRSFTNRSVLGRSPAAPQPPYGVLTYLANQLRCGERTTPYSMVAAAPAPLLLADLGEEEIILSQWLADDLQAAPGSVVDLTYFVPDMGSQLAERTNRFRVRAVLPMDHPALDRSLMPDFPGMARAEKAGDWQTGFPLVHKIREKDDAYWKQYRGTPKAFVSLATGERLWGNRFGRLTAVRFPVPDTFTAELRATRLAELEQSMRGLLANAPASIFRFEPVRAQALAASAPTQDFGGLFLGLSFFLILAALILMALLFQFGLEQRMQETGTLLAVGFTPARVRRLLLGEGIAVALAGGLLGALGGIGYARGMIHALTTLWREAVGQLLLEFHATPPTVLAGVLGSVLVCAVTLWWGLRTQARQPARLLLAGAEAGAFEGIESAHRPDAPSHREEGGPRGRRPSSRARWTALLAIGSALALIGGAVFQADGASAELFFTSGSLLLVGLLATVSLLFTRLDRSGGGGGLPSLAALGLRGCARRRSRSLASVALLACGCFLVVAVGANRLDAGRKATERSAGTGGFAWIGEATLPLVRDLNTPGGREFYNLDETVLREVQFVPFRVKDGDAASCLNLNQARAPRLLGVDPTLLARRNAFTFAGAAKGRTRAEGWNLLRPTATPPEGRTPEVPAIGDDASIKWVLHKKLGETLDYTDELGRPFRVRLVGSVANSILQGNLIIADTAFLEKFPGSGGHRMFLVDAPSKSGAGQDLIAARLAQALRDVGLELTSAERKLAAFNGVQNTYLDTFQVLGGLGLLLGSAGLGVVVLRNVLERRGELALLQAVGFRPRSVRWLVLSEHGGLLLIGLAVGMVSALAAVLPALLAPGAQLHYAALGATLAGVLGSGLVWTWIATRLAMRGQLLGALRGE